MYKVRLIDELNIATTQGFTNRFDNDAYAGIIYYVAATKAGSVIAEDVMGRIRVNYGGDDIVNAPHSVLSKWCDLLYGKPRSTTGAAGVTSYYGAFIPFFHPSLPNAIHKEEGEGLNFYIEKAQVAVDSATCYVYGVIDDGVEELYVPRFVTLSGTASAGTQKLLIDMPNIASVMLTAPATTDPTLVQMLVDNKLRQSGSWQILEDLTNVVSRVESTLLDVILLDNVQKGELNETLSDEATLLITGGSGAFTYTFLSLKFNPVKTTRTAIKVNALRNAQLAARTPANAGVQVSVLRRPENKSVSLRKDVARKLEREAPHVVSPGVISTTLGVSGGD